LHFDNLIANFDSNIGVMSVQELKQEIYKVVDNMPEEILQNILEYFKELEHSSKDRIKMAQNIKTILSEDRELLHKLAL
jgi:RNase adaptor protein for sRNA GlmZ degradation